MTLVVCLVWPTEECFFFVLVVYLVVVGTESLSTWIHTPCTFKECGEAIVWLMENVERDVCFCLGG